MQEFTFWQLYNKFDDSGMTMLDGLALMMGSLHIGQVTPGVHAPSGGAVIVMFVVFDTPELSVETAFIVAVPAEFGEE